MTAIHLEALVHVYPEGDVRALDGIDLEIPTGEALGLIGANGSGKSTLARLLVGLLRPTAGRVLLDGQDIAAQRVARLAAQVGLTFAPDRQIFGRDVRTEVEFGARRLGATDAEAAARAMSALEAAGLAEDIRQHPDDLGEARRRLLTIASVLAMRTPIVVLDEPTAGLDGRGAGRVISIVRGLHAEGRTVIVISHDLRLVAETCGRVVVLDDGRVALDGAPTEVFAEAAWPRLRAAGLEPPAAAVAGARLGLGSTPRADDVAAALRRLPHRNRAVT